MDRRDCRLEWLARRFEGLAGSRSSGLNGKPRGALTSLSEKCSNNKSLLALCQSVISLSDATVGFGNYRISRRENATKSSLKEGMCQMSRMPNKCYYGFMQRL
jgi:hypothetical protein